MRALAMTGMETASMIPSIRSGSLMRATPPWARMSAGTRSRAITATAPASSAIFACSASTTSMMTPPLSISAMPRLTREVPVVVSLFSMPPILRGEHWRLSTCEPSGVGALNQLLHGLLRTRLVGADEPGRAALDPADDVGPVAHPAAVVGHHSPGLVERQVRQRDAVVADGAEHRAGLEVLAAVGA